MHLAMWEYLEVNCIGVVLLLIMFLYVQKVRAFGEICEQHYFQTMLAINAFILLFDNGIYLLRGHNAKPLFILNHIICCLYFILHAWFCYFWIRYVIVKLYPRHRETVFQKVSLLLPAMLNMMAVLLSPATGLIYTLSAENRYHRGSFMWITFAVGGIYSVVNTVIIVREMIHPSMSRDRSTYMSLLLFPIPPIIGNLIQLKFYGFSIVWICMAITLLVLFVDMQSGLLARDALTGLVNRRQTNKQLIWEVQHLHQSPDFFFVAMIDVDHFKLINDQYGHLTGDKALECIGSILRKSCRKNDFISRFGGDEFLITGHIKNESDASVIEKRITESAEKMNESGLIPCHLSLSIGTATFNKNSTITIDSILNDADKYMYMTKKESHNQ